MSTGQYITPRRGNGFVDMTGKKFGRLTVVGMARIRESKPTASKPHGKKVARWLCQCSCGKKSEVDGGNLRSGRTVSCGCYLQEAITKHGQAAKKTREYRVWFGAKHRCSTGGKKRKQYKDYGGRGITMCDEWRASFAAFFSYVGRSPSPMHTLDRIDNDRGYEPGNVKWSLPREQMRNRRNTRWIEYKGETKCATDWAEKYQVPLRTLTHWLAKFGTEEAFRKCEERQHYYSHS